MKLYWKMFLPLALAVLVSILITGWFVGSVVPRHLRSRQEALSRGFHSAVVSMRDPTPDIVLALADSMGVRIRLIPEDRLRLGSGGRQEPPPLPGTVIVPARPGFPFTVVGMVPLPASRLSIAAGALAVLLVLEGLVLHLVLRGVFRRIRDLQHAAAVIGKGDTTIRCPDPGGRDELDALGRSFNQMALRIDGLLASHKELMGSVAHELRTPLARLSLALELLREGQGPKEEMFSRMEADMASLNDLVTELLEYNRLGRGVKPVKELTDIASVAEEVMASESWRREGIVLSLMGGATVRTDRGMVARVLSNLVSNAVRHAAARVEVSVCSSPGEVAVTVQDDGPGFPQSVLSGGFAPFLRGRESHGVGLGMSIAIRAASLIDGEILAENAPEGGARVTLVIRA